MPVPFCTQDAEHPAQTAKDKHQCKAGQLHFRWFNVLRKAEPQQKQNKQPALYSTADKTSAVIEKAMSQPLQKLPAQTMALTMGQAVLCARLWLAIR